MKHRQILLISLLTLLLILPFSVPIFAQNYSFSVPTSEIIFWIEKDGQVSISYSYTLQNSGKALDYIDIGLPNNTYNTSDVNVQINGLDIPSKLITRAKYEDSGLTNGITVDRSSSPIPSGSVADVYVYVPNIRSILYKAEDSTDTPQAGFNFSPNFFSSKFVSGKTDTTVRLVLPPGIAQDAPKYMEPKNWPGENKPQVWKTADDYTVYEWKSSVADSATSYTFGASFPTSALNDSTAANIAASGTISASGSSSMSFEDLIFEILGYLVCSSPIIFLVLFIVSRIRKAQKRKNSPASSGYLPPEIFSDGQGVKRGLTAIEAAVLLETPLDKIITMIIFSLCKKNAIQVVSENPFEIKPESSIPDNLKEYETGFIAAAQLTKNEKRVQAMEEMLHKLILSVTQKMKGFNAKETKSYYESITQKAWKQIAEANTPELKGQKMEEVFGWIVMDKKLEKQTTEVFGADPVYLPIWWLRTAPQRNLAEPIGTQPLSIPASGGGGLPTAPQMPTLPGADFARSITDSVRGFGESTVGGVRQFTDKMTNRANPSAAPSSSKGRSSGSGKNGGSSCACACACVSCACACAGGGR